MFERFATDARTIVKGAWEEARAAGAGTVEAEHLLLALSLKPEIRKLGLDHDDIAEALAGEEEHSLAAVGINLSDYDAPVTRRQAGNPRLRASARLAIQRALTVTARRGQPSQATFAWTSGNRSLGLDRTQEVGNHHNAWYRPAGLPRLTPVKAWAIIQPPNSLPA